MCVWGGCVIHRCQNKNPRTRGCEWCHAPEACAEDFRAFEKKSVELSSALEEEGRLSLACRGLVVGATRVGGWADGKASIKRLCLSPYVEKPFNSKVIKSFVPEWRSRKCFSYFRIPMFYVYMLWTFYVRFTYSYMATVHYLKPYNFMNYLKPYNFMNYLKPYNFMNYLKPYNFMNYLKPYNFMNYLKPYNFMNYLKPYNFMNYLKPYNFMNYLKPYNFMNYLKPYNFMNYLKPYNCI